MRAMDTQTYACSNSVCYVLPHKHHVNTIPREVTHRFLTMVNEKGVVFLSI